MTIRIAHASISEHGTVNGSKGDQTGREVCIRNWWNFGYSYVLRVKNDQIRAKMIQNAIDGANNNNIGYSQADRNSLHTLLRANGYNFKTVGRCNTDCSAFITAICIGAGLTSLEYSGNAPTTSTLKSALLNTGMFEIFTKSDLLNTDKNLLQGDILLAPGNHVVIALDTGENVIKFFESLAHANNAKAGRADVFYCVNTVKRFLPEVKNKDDYAGIKYEPINNVACKVSQGIIHYQVHVKGGGWLPYVTGYNWFDKNNGYAGCSKLIDGFRAYGENLGGTLKYRVAPTGKDYLPVVTEDRDYAGIFGQSIDRIQMWVE